MRAKLTKTLVGSLVKGEREQVIWDETVAGFGIRVTEGGARSYIVQYRTAEGRTRRLALGSASVLTPEKARDCARDLLQAARQGGDPSGERKRIRHAIDMGGLADRYLKEHVAHRNKPKSRKQFTDLVERFVRPELGSLKAGAITREDIEGLHRRLKATPRQANLVLAVLSKMFSLAEAWGARPEGSNPCRRIARYKEERRERFLTEVELAAVGAELDRPEATGELNAGAACAIRLLALSGCRASEILNLRWEHVDLERGLLRLPDSKTGPRHHAIGERAIAILKALPRRQRVPWVLTATGDKPIRVDVLDGAWRRIRAAAGVPDVRLHDLRHTVGTYAGQMGASAFLVRDKRGHASTAMTDRYVNRDHDALRLLSDAVEERVGDALKGKKKQDDFIT